MTKKFYESASNDGEILTGRHSTAFGLPKVISRCRGQAKWRDECEAPRISAMDVTNLIDRYCRVWNEDDPSERENLLASLWSPNATYTDPSVHAASAQELLTHIASVRARRPGASVVRTSAVDIHHGIARFMWHVVEADGTTLPEGIDIAVVSPDGSRIERVIGFFGPVIRPAK